MRLSGFEKTRADTALALLPRQPPARYSLAELEEFERRLNNLALFDQVDVTCRAGELSVGVREKWTVVPVLDFASGKTFEDSYALLGATEYNLLGRAHQLALSVYREQRGFGFTIGFNEHDYQRHAWAFGSELEFSTVALQFEDGSGWRTSSASLDLSFRSPPWLHDYFNYIAGFYGSYESVHGAVRATSVPPTTGVLQTYFGFSWDAYEWHDLVPRGSSTSLWIGIGGSLGRNVLAPRHSLEYSIQGALPLAPRAVLIARGRFALGTRGNVNYGTPLGSVDGVRGLRDAFYFTWLQAVSNLELRRSIPLGRRWALQIAGFTDAALFEPMTAEGARGRADYALSLGAGLRVLPTWLSSIVLRVDAARLVAPEGSWFAQLGLSQYF